MSDGLLQAIRLNPTHEEPWAAWYRFIYPRLYYVAYRLARGNVEAARDLVQESFARFLRFRGIDHVKSDAHSIAYLIETCRNVAATRFARADEISLDGAEGVFESFAAETTGDLQFLLRRVIKELAPHDRQLMQWVLDGVTLPEIARKLHITYTAAGVRLHRLKNEVGERLGL